MMKNPKECVCIQKNQTFFVLNELTIPECKDGSEPLTFHHDTFSRFKFVLINKEKRPATANVPVNELPAIFQKIRNLSLRDMLSVQKQKSEPSKSPAYTTTINAGTLKGKTPAALLLEDAQTNKRLLINQKNWLESNLGRYPRNAAQITAIEDALRLYEAGQLNAEESKAGFQAETVYSSGMRPLIRRKRGDKYFVYEISIRWDGASEKPVEIDIRNYYAPVTRTEKGLLNVKAKEREGEIRNEISLTLEEWLWVEHMLESNIRTFEDLYARNHYKQAYEAEKELREALRKDGKIAS